MTAGDGTGAGGPPAPEPAGPEAEEDADLTEAEEDAGLADAWAVILAGGTGTRFWPASRPDRPKQLLPLGGDRPLFVETWERAAAVVGAERVRVVARPPLLAAFRRLVPDLAPERGLPEPIARGTGPALTWATHHLAARDPEAVVVAMHADHLIEPLSAFRRTVGRAVRAARRERRLYCIGARPDRPETGYGYLWLGPERAPGVFDARAFVEKPDRRTAAEYVASGDHLWNTGIFVWRAADFLEAVRAHAPEIAPALPALERGDVEGFFSAVTPVSVDVGVLERSDRVGIVEAEFRWDDVGVWNALARTRPADASGNVGVGRVRPVASHDNVVWAEEGRVTLFGVEGLVVVRSGDETLVTTRERAPRLKELLAQLETAEREAAAGVRGVGRSDGDGAEARSADADGGAERNGGT